MPEHAKTMDLAERRAAEHSLFKQRQQAREDFVRYSEQQAEAERAYRKLLAKEFARKRSEGESAAASEIAARAAASDHAHRRDIAHSLAKAALLRIEETERGSVVLRDLHSSSERVDGLAA